MTANGDGLARPAGWRVTPAGFTDYSWDTPKVMWIDRLDSVLAGLQTMTVRFCLVLSTCLALADVSSVWSQVGPYDKTLLTATRAVARAVPGDLPTGVGYLSIQDDSAPGSNAVDGAPHANIFDVNTVFQVRFRRGWIMVDAGYDKEAAADIFGHYHADAYEQVLQALDGARLIVATHEHGDHVGSLLQPSVARRVAYKTILTKQQVDDLLHERIRGALTPEAPGSFLIVDYQRLLPIAPGVVLIRAPGHTPGSQIVYVQLASGREVMLIGDIVWRMIGLELRRQKPDSVSTQLGEDRTTIGQEMTWLDDVIRPAGVAVVASHDGSAIHALVGSGALREGLDLTSP
jgi:glyoxylase-like metal-dependent hydrolase (beta-lactamase superfamily II)